MTDVRSARETSMSSSVSSESFSMEEENGRDASSPSSLSGAEVSNEKPNSPTMEDPSTNIACTPLPDSIARYCPDRSPVFILSKGRQFYERGTVALFIQDDAPFTLVVEKDEYNEYCALVAQLYQRARALKEDQAASGSKPTTSTDAKKESSSSAADTSGKIGPNASAASASNGTSAADRDSSEDNDATSPATAPTQPQSAPPAKKPVRQFMLDPFMMRRLKKKAENEPPLEVPPHIQVVCLPESNQGVSYVRNYILRTLAPKVTQESGGWYWVMDDDIKVFAKAVQNKNVTVSVREMFREVSTRIEALYAAPERYAPSVGPVDQIVVFSIEYARYAYFAAETDMTANSYNNIACLFKHDLIPDDAEYRFRIREDYDFTLQMILTGRGTLRFRSISFDVPVMARNQGGLTEYYKTQKNDIRFQNKLFVDTWPCIAMEWTKGKGELERDDIRVRWDLLNPRKARSLNSLAASTGVPGAPTTASMAPRRKHVKGVGSSPTSCDAPDGDGSENDSAVRGLLTPAEYLQRNVPLPVSMTQQPPRAIPHLATPMGFLAPPFFKGMLVPPGDPFPERNCIEVSPTSTTTARKLYNGSSNGATSTPSSESTMTTTTTTTMRRSTEPHTKQTYSVDEDVPRKPSSVQRKRRRSHSSSSESDAEDSEGTDEDGDESIPVVTIVSDSDTESSSAESDSELQAMQIERKASPPPRPASSRSRSPVPSVSQTVNAPLKPASRAASAQPPRTSSPAGSQQPKGWFGYSMEVWRCMTPACIQTSGLKLLDSATIKPGMQVAVVPERITIRPSVLVGTIIEQTGDSEWSFVASRARGVPIISVHQCFKIPDDIEKRIAQVDKLFDK